MRRQRTVAALEGIANVVVNSDDKRAGKLVLTRKGRRRVGYISKRFEKGLLTLLGAREELSDRVQDFKDLLLEASAPLAPSDLAGKEAIAPLAENRKLTGDNSLRYIEGDAAESVWTREVPPED
jgi:hypothetical protein